jgi:AcrR family transcriptional regulator
MKVRDDIGNRAEFSVDPIDLLDPARPVISNPAPRSRAARSAAAQRQRQRRSIILAAIRGLLIEEGYKGVTVRRVAALSGHVVQTVYNQVGPREHAIVEAISDYTAFVGSLAPPDPEDPAAMLKLIEWQGKSVLRVPEFTRQVCLIALTSHRHVFYAYRERQVRAVKSLLVRQKRSGVLRRDAECGDLARDIMTLSGATFVEWAEGAVPDRMLIARLRSGYRNILAGAISPKFGGMSALPV